MKFRFIKTRYDTDKDGHFGEFGGRYVPEVLMKQLAELERAYYAARRDPEFSEQISEIFKNYVGRPTPLYYCGNLTKKCGGAKIYIKNEGLAHTGAHKINHCVGQALLAKRIGKMNVVAETGAGQHGLATATIAAKLGLGCTIYMGKVDYDRQRPNVFWMELLGANVIAVTDGTKRLKDAAIAAMKHWTAHCDDTYFLLGSVIGPHPYPTIIKDFQTIVGLEVQHQLLQYGESIEPDYCIACVGGGSNAIGLFNPFLDNDKVILIGVEAGGRGVHKKGQHASKISGKARVGVTEGYKSLFLQNNDGQILPTHSISAGIDYAGIGPQHSLLHASGRVKYVSATDSETLDAFKELAKTEGILCALESAHAVAHAIKIAKRSSQKQVIVVNLSGRGDKDLFITAKEISPEMWGRYLFEQAKL